MAKALKIIGSNGQIIKIKIIKEQNREQYCFYIGGKLCMAINNYNEPSYSEQRLMDEWAKFESSRPARAAAYAKWLAER